MTLFESNLCFEFEEEQFMDLVCNENDYMIDAFAKNMSVLDISDNGYDVDINKLVDEMEDDLNGIIQ